MGILNVQNDNDGPFLFTKSNYCLVIWIIVLNFVVINKAYVES